VEDQMANKLVEIAQGIFALMIILLVLGAVTMALSMMFEIFTGIDFINDYSRPFFEEMQ